jgi:hypothetical protein
MVQYMPMIAGIRKRMRNTGQVLSADAHVIYAMDKFHQVQGDDPKIIHDPVPLGQERGQPIGAYAIIKLANGEVLREVMSRAEIEHIRKHFSKAPNSPAWVKTPETKCGRKRYCGGAPRRRRAGPISTSCSIARTSSTDRTSTARCGRSRPGPTLANI